MKKEHIEYINFIEGIKTTIKNTHWSSVNNSEHVRMDEFADIIAEYEDTIAEEFQGIEGQVDDNEVKPISYTYSNPKKLLNDVKEKTIELYKTLENDIEYIGIRSEIESFIHEINKYKYLFKLALRAESKVFKLTENDIKDIITETVRNYIKKMIE